MRKILINGLIFLFILINKSGYGQLIKRVNIGVQYWKASQNYYHERLGVNVADCPGKLLGPTLSLQAGGLTMGTSMFFGSFNWPIIVNDNLVEMNLQRNYIDFFLGLNYEEYFDFFIMVKNLSLEGEKSYTDLENRDYRTKVEDKGTLFGGGFSGIYVFPQLPVFMLTSATYSFGSMRTALTQYLKDVPVDEFSDNWQYDSNSVSVMLGMGYQFNNGFSIRFSYRRDTSHRNTAGELRFRGWLLTLSYTYPQYGNY
ncbi:hypothetical protein JW824_03970 [bacterium]|nr:hypothetical protein [bacterium]